MYKKYEIYNFYSFKIDENMKLWWFILRDNRKSKIHG